MLNLNIPIEKLKYVGHNSAKRLAKLGIKTVKDLLWHFPLRYEDFREKFPIADLKPNQKASAIGRVLSIENKRSPKRRIILTNALIEDKTGQIKAIWYNQPFLVNIIKPNIILSLSGNIKLDKYGLYFQNPAYEVIKSEFNDLKFFDPKHTAGIIPIYPETEGLTSRYLRFLIKPLLGLTKKINEFLPREILIRQDIYDIKTALKEIHFPKSLESAQKARKRFAFEELFLLQLKALSEKRKIQTQKAYQIKFNQELIKKFVESLPFELTNSQKIALWEIIKDLGKPYPMNRLLNGDVGSGKTILAIASALETLKAGFQVAVMAPTEVLANQHFQTFDKFLRKFGAKLGLLTSSGIKEQGVFGDERPKSGLKKKFLEKVSNGEVDIVIGTHSLIQKDIKFHKLALVIIDEQHRFGVEQRAALIKNDKELNNSANITIPHLLSMTATPIPRTLALTIYGDLDISILDEMPRGRLPLETRLISPDKRKEAYEFIREEVKNGRQVFVICPRIESKYPDQEQSYFAPDHKKIKQLSLKDYLKYEVKAVKTEYEKLSKKIFPDLRIAMLHGKLKGKEKEEIMNKFKNGEIDILVSTSVIEVGVDIQNASIMMIEGAEHFGLAQLHQFRGRVGRGSNKGYCLLFTESPLIGTTRRLEALLKSNSGFKLAEMDLKIRGPGEFFGKKQSGLPDLAMTSLADIELIKKSRAEAKFILSKGIKNYPLLEEKLIEFSKTIHFE